jgi:hypothetical protein
VEAKNYQPFAQERCHGDQDVCTNPVVTNMFVLGLDHVKALNLVVLGGHSVDAATERYAAYRKYNGKGSLRWATPRTTDNPAVNSKRGHCPLLLIVIAQQT